VATIGIRGTEYTIEYGHSVTGTVGEGQIEVCNGGGCLSVTNGESYYVQGQEVKPVLTNKRTDLPPPSPEAPPQAFKQNETVDSNGDPCALFPENCNLLAAPQLLTGSGNFHVGWATQFGGTGVELAQPTVLDKGQLMSFTRFESVSPVSGPYSEVGGDDIIVWGRAASFSGGEALHYVVGVPTLDFSALGGMTGTYTLLGATSITDSNNLVIGKLTSTTLTADFSTFSPGTSGSIGIVMTMQLGSQNYDSKNPISGSGFMCNGSFSFFCATALSGSAIANGQGFFAGTNAVRAGFVYTVSDSNQEISGHGAAGLKQTSLAVTPAR